MPPPPEANDPAARPPAPTGRRAGTVALLASGYSGYYLCRSNLSVATPMLLREWERSGMTADGALAAIGWVVSLGTIAYSLGKFASGGLTDYFGGRSSFLLGMVGAVGFTALFALGGGLPLFTIAWFGNRLLQSIGWPGMVKVVGRWFSYRSYGAVMAVVSLSYLFGDAASRWFLGLLIGWGMGWRGLFWVAATVLAGLAALNFALLRESPESLGYGSTLANPTNVYGLEGADARPRRLRDLIRPLLRSPAFWMVCGLSAGLTLLRESFSNWTPTYFSQGVGLSDADAASASALFPLIGGVSVLLAGFGGDRLGRSGRSAILCGGLAALGVVLIALGRLDFGGGRAVPIALVSLAGFLLIGPYSFLAGAVALDFGGKRGGATASGLIDGFGYLGGTAAGFGVARVAGAFGWSGVFLGLSGVAWASTLVAALWWRHQAHAGRPLSEAIS